MKRELITRLRLALALATNRNRPGRQLTVFPDDAWLVSYPKSGNTWARFLLANLMSEDEPATFTNIDRRFPIIYQHRESVLLAMDRPRLLKSHEYLDPRYKRVIYLVRDPRDVIISYYHHHLRLKWIADDCSMEAFAPRFIEGDLDPYGSWGEHVGGWLGARKGDPDFLMLRYEDMLADPESALAAMARFLGIVAEDNKISKAVAFSSADQMRKMEKEQWDQWKPAEGARKDKPFVREARANQWLDKLSPSIVTAIENKWRPLIESLEYEISGPAPIAAQWE